MATLASGISAFFRSGSSSRSVATSAESSRWMVSRAVTHALLPCAMKLLSAGCGESARQSPRQSVGERASGHGPRVLSLRRLTSWKQAASKPWKSPAASIAAKSST